MFPSLLLNELKPEPGVCLSFQFSVWMCSGKNSHRLIIHFFFSINLLNITNMAHFLLIFIISQWRFHAVDIWPYKTIYDLSQAHNICPFIFYTSFRVMRGKAYPSYNWARDRVHLGRVASPSQRQSGQTTRMERDSNQYCKSNNHQ